MLSIHVLKSSSAAGKYYTEILDYYGKEAQGIWYGKLKESLNLSPEIKPQDFTALLEGKLHGTKLNNSMTDKHRPGFDLTFSAPKSVSILSCLDICPEFIKYHDAAVNYALNQIEQEFAQVRVKHKGEITYHNTASLLFAKFREFTSRSSDPQLHTHVVTMNLSKYQDKILSLASDMNRVDGVIENIQNNLKYCGMLYRSHLAKALKEQGFSLTAKDNGLFEISGLPEGVLDKFSKRRADITAFMEGNNLSGAKDAAFATLATRTSKEAVCFQDLKAHLKIESQAFNLNPKDLTKQSFFADMLGSNTKLTSLKPIFEALADSKIAFSEREIIAQTLNLKKSVAVLPHH
jgi:conjugative relaxase-like TrwC/TraI family protein